MPDKRLKGSSQYSTHPPTVRARRRQTRMTGEEKVIFRGRMSEYQSLWQFCDRLSRKPSYLRVNLATRRVMLVNGMKALLENRYSIIQICASELWSSKDNAKCKSKLTPRPAHRKKIGKTTYGTSPDVMADRHLDREAKLRSLHRTDGIHRTSIGLQGIAVDPYDNEDEVSDIQLKDDAIDYHLNAHEPRAPQAPMSPTYEKTNPHALFDSELSDLEQPADYRTYVQEQMQYLEDRISKITDILLPSIEEKCSENRGLSDHQWNEIADLRAQVVSLQQTVKSLTEKAGCQTLVPAEHQQGVELLAPSIDTSYFMGLEDVFQNQGPLL